MQDFIINAVIWILALYGLIEIIKNIIYIYTYTNFNSDGIYVIIATKNQEEKVEGFLRTTIFKIHGKEEIPKNIIITDLDSRDNTLKIINKLQKEYSFVKFLKWKDCKQLIENIKEN